jgi:epoxide hydrolase-like predicted phosphatase
VAIEAVLVDLGGVWIQAGSFEVRDRWAAEHGMTSDELWAAYIDAVGPGAEAGRTEPEVHRRLADTLGIELDDIAEVIRVLHAHEVLDPDLTAFLASVRAERQLGVITNAGPSARRHLDRRFGLSDLVDLLVVSAEEGVTKPDPRIYLAASERLAVPPATCVFVDDKPANVDGARAVGMHAIRFVTVPQTIADLRTALEADSPTAVGR